MGNGLMTSEMIGYEETCDFILPQKKKEGKKAIFPFEVSPNSKHMYKKATNIIEDRFTTLSPPSTISTLSLRVPEEESVPEEMRYIRDGFNAIQGFIENLGKYDYAYLNSFRLRVKYLILIFFLIETEENELIIHR